MRLVIATTVHDPLAATFWRAYSDSGGNPPDTVFFIERPRPSTFIRQFGEALLLFGPLDAWRSWRAGRMMRQTLLRDPQRVFPGAVIHHVSSLNRGRGFELLQRTSSTLLVSVGAPEIFRPPVLDLPSLGAINVHNGRLPAYRGLFGTFWEMRHREQLGYASLHKMVPKADAGPVLAEVAVPLAGRRLFSVLETKKHEGGRLLAWLVRFIDREGVFPPVRFGGDPRSKYYAWPGWRDLLVYRLVVLRSFREAASGAVFYWPPEVVGEEA